ncbi:MAG: NDP-hexose 2,3-dehydratase family protein [Actinocatenispora sp.]
MQSIAVTPPGLCADDGDSVADRFTHSARQTAGLSTAECLDWLARRRRAHNFQVRQIPFAELTGWGFDGSGDLVHDSGRFFSLAGLRATRDSGPSATQPIIVQPEVGILGILVKEFDGVLHCLMQAKMEPGNSNVVQLSPTVQATRSNYTRIHRGGTTPYLEYFVAPRAGRVLSDALQTEQGSWFLHKRNRNIVVETDDDVEVLDDFRWLTVGQVYALLRLENVVNMDARTVLAGMPFAPLPVTEVRDPFGDALNASLDPVGPARHTMTAVASWLTEHKATHELVQQRIPLREVTGWHRDADRIARPDGREFSVIAVDVRAGSREVTTWSQPLLAPSAYGLMAFLVARIDGVLHVLLQARAGAGTFDLIEASPTVQCTPEDHADQPPELRPRYLDLVLDAEESRIRYDTLLSEEGGRFHHALNRYRIVEVDAEFAGDEPDEYRWVTVRQLMGLVRAGNCLNVEARSLLACLLSLR